MDSSQNEIDYKKLANQAARLFENDQQDEALPLYVQLVEKFSDNWLYHANLATCYKTAKQQQYYVLSEKHFLEAINITKEKHPTPIYKYLGFLMHVTLELSKGAHYDLEYFLHHDKEATWKDC